MLLCNIRSHMLLFLSSQRQQIVDRRSYVAMQHKEPYIVMKSQHKVSEPYVALAT